MITRVKLSNWKSHKNTIFQLSEGTNVLVGPMGSGKSSALEGITYALFGTLPSVKNRTIKLEDLIRNRPNKEESAEVQVEFEAPDGNEYKVKRVIERGKGTTYAEIRDSDGKLIDKPQSTRITEYVIRLLELDYDLFEKMIYSEQNKLDYFLSLPPGKRKENLDRLLGIDKLENARKNTNTIINRLRDKKDNKKNDLKELREDEEINSLQQLEVKLKELKIKVTDLKDERDNLGPRIKEVKSRIKELEELRREIREIEKNIMEIKASLRPLKNQIDEIKAELGDDTEIPLEELKSKYSYLDKKIKHLSEKLHDNKTQYEKYSSRFSELKGRKDTIENRISELYQEIQVKKEIKKELLELRPQKLIGKFNELNEKDKEINREITIKETRLEEIDQIIKELKKAETNCPVCEKPLTEKHRRELLEEKNEDFEEIKNQIKVLEDRSSRVKKEINRIQELKDKARKLKEEARDLSKLKRELEKQKDIYEAIESNLNKINESRDESKEELERIDEKLSDMQSTQESISQKIERHEKLKENLEEERKLEEENKKLMRKFREINKIYTREYLEKLKGKYEDLILKDKEIQTEISEKKKLITEKEERIRNIRRKKQRLDRYIAEFESLDHGIKSLNKIKNALAYSQTTLRGRIIDAVNTVMNDLWNDIYPYQDFSSIRLAIIKNRGMSDYDLQLQDLYGGWSSVDGMASGGERTSSALTLRIAFAEVLVPHLSWLVLDEPTHNLDSEGIETLSLVLKKRMPKIMRQLILITHERRLESAVSGYLHRFYRDKSIESSTEIRTINTG